MSDLSEVESRSLLTGDQGTTCTLITSGREIRQRTECILCSIRLTTVYGLDILENRE